MEDYRRSMQVPAFGGWDYSDDGDLPFTQCFESAADRYGCRPEERDLYVAGDLYQNDVVTPAVILVPRPRLRKTKGKHPNDKKQKQEWGHELSKQPPTPPPSPPPRFYAAVDEDLYHIPSHLLRPRPKRKRGLGFFTSCLLPACAS